MGETKRKGESKYQGSKDNVIFSLLAIKVADTRKSSLSNTFLKIVGPGTSKH